VANLDLVPMQPAVPDLVPSRFDVAPVRADLEIGHPRFRALGHALHRAGLGQQFFAALAALCPTGALNLGRPSKIFSRPRYLILGRLLSGLLPQFNLRRGIIKLLIPTYVLFLYLIPVDAMQ
jgi:hypothetical protein